MKRSNIGAILVGFGLTIAGLPACAADYSVYPTQQRYASDVIHIDRGPNPYCGPRCGCPIPVRVRHRQLVQYYPSSFDPRTRDEPRYAYGANRTYVRFANPRNPDRVLEY